MRQLPTESLAMVAPREGRRNLRLAAAVLAAVALTACDSLVDVPAPSRVAADGLAIPSNAGLLVNSVGADFECALANYAVAGGLTGNELEVATGGIVIKEYDKRDFKTFGSSYAESTCDPGNPGVYKPLSTARFQADNTLGLLQGWSDQEVPDRQAKIATVAAYGGYSYLLLGEAMCSAAFDLGPEQTPTQIWGTAEARFTTAIAAAQSAGSADLLALARVGRARTRMRLGHGADAATDAHGVPAGFRFDATYSGDSQRRYNVVWSMLEFFQEVSVDPTYMDVKFGGVPDPRVAAFDVGKKGGNGVTELWSTHKYPGNNAPIPLATWEEAQLIIAEVEGGQTAVNIINALHDAVGLPHFSSGDPAQIKAQIVEEREREFFLDGHHLGDLKQYQIPLSPPAGAPFRDGGGVYLGQVCFPLPDNERLNNPNLH
jgi:starch-binding outer membrane protein, SusD/RagB family